MNLKREVSVAKMAKDAEDLFRGGFFCPEVVVCSIRSDFEMSVPEEVTAMASGLPIGTGRSRCLCGAVSRGVMATGLVSGRMIQKNPQVKQTLALPKELYNWFKMVNGKNALCCRTLTREFDMGTRGHKEQYIHFTGLVAGKVAGMIIREKGLTNIDEQECTLMIEKMPLPTTGIMLGVVAPGDLFQSYSEGVRLLCGTVSLTLGVLIVIKIVLYPGQSAGDMENPIMAGVSGTFSMTVILPAGYVKLFMGGNAVIIWYVDIGLYIALMVYFTARFMIHLKMQQVFASYYTVCVGVTVVSVTAPAFDRLAVGTAVLWFGFVAAPILLVLVTYRYMSFKQIPEPAQPLFCIYTVPVGLYLARCTQFMQSKSLGLVLFVMTLSLVIYITVLIKTPAYLKMKFYPSYAAFIFPFVITAVGLKIVMACLDDMGHPVPVLSYTVVGETIIASVLTVHALVRYGMVTLERGR